jgi:hypothetical protein
MFENYFFNFILLKDEQPKFYDKQNWQKTYELD